MHRTADERTSRSPWRALGWGLAAALLLAPLVAMQFTGEVNWTASDFLFAAVLIGGVGIGLELAVRTTGHRTYRAAAALGLLTAFLVTWANAAVGILGSEDNPVNLMFTAVVALALIGALLARGRARSLGRAMAVAGIGQLIVPAIGFVIWSPPVTPELGRALLFNGVFGAMWLTSAWLFGRAARA